ncbi:hypothetical protein HOD08_01235, partial [bacterium]|nr:hypothetical protein [bacterium]
MESAYKKISWLFFAMTFFCASENISAAFPKLPDLPGMAPPLPGGPPKSSTPSPSSSGPSASAPLAPGAPPPKPVVGPDTVNHPPQKVGLRGNWVKKRTWLIEARKQEERALGAAEAIGEVHQKIIGGEAGKIDNDFDEFYRKLGSERGKVSELMESLEQKLLKQEEAIAKVSGSSAIEYDNYDDQDKLHAHKGDLEQTKMDLQALVDLDHVINEHVGLFKKYAQGTVTDIDEIGKLIDSMMPMFDHEKARTIFYKVKGISEKVVALKEFLSDKLNSNFKSEVDKARSQMKKAEESVSKIERKILEIGKRATTRVVEKDPDEE